MLIEDKAAPVIAIDGPSASGKGTVAAGVAAALGLHYLDSGALYRIVALAAQDRGLRVDDEAIVAPIVPALSIRFGVGRVVLDGRDVTDAIRTEPVSAGSSKVAAMPRVRAALLDRQRAFRQAPGLVADGRDMGSVVFPDAVLKVFLTARLETRAERRYKQLMDKGISDTLPGLLQELRERDERDSSRRVAPLVQLPDARLLDTTDMTVEAAIATVIGWYEGIPKPA
jgi:cytidylate kinase